jgi:uncharacterized protein YhfF
MKNENIIQFWEHYRKMNPKSPTEYVAWAFGNTKEMGDHLAQLVLEGTKTATASNFLLYEIEQEALPDVGLYNIILDGNGEAVAIAVTTSVEVVPFEEVTEEHAYLEGEGDRTITYWREVHEDFFTKELEGVNEQFHHKIPIV